MRKILAVLLAAMLGMTGCAMAEASYGFCEKDIQMFDVDWSVSCSSLTEYIRKKYNVSMANISDELNYIPTLRDLVRGSTEDAFHIEKDLGIHSTCGSRFKVGGYDVDRVNLYYIYYPVDGAILRTEEAAGFLAGEYVFYPSNVKSMYQDLLDKIVSTYGEPIFTGDTCDAFFPSDVVCYYSNVRANQYTIWFSSSNKAYLILKSSEYSSGPVDSEIEIIYASYYYDYYIQRANEAVLREKTAAESSVYGNGDTDGL